MMYEPLPAVVSIVIGLPDVRFVLSANAYSEKLEAGAKPIFASPRFQLPNDWEPPDARPSWSYADPVDAAVNTPVFAVKP